MEKIKIQKTPKSKLSDSYDKFQYVGKNIEEF